MKKMRRNDARKIVYEIADTLFKETERRGHHIRVGEGDIKTERELVGIRQDIEVSLWREMRSQYDLDDC